MKGQALDETCKPSGSWKTKARGEVCTISEVYKKSSFDPDSQELGTERENDGLILDCCQYFFRVRQCRTFLCSKDKLLAVEAESVGMWQVSEVRVGMTKAGRNSDVIS